MSSFEDDLEKARKDKIPVIALRYDPKEELDDVVVERPRTFRAEMMDEGSLWMACYFENGEELVFWVRAHKNKLLFDVTIEPKEWIDWDELRSNRD